MNRILDPIRVEFVSGGVWRVLTTFKYHIGAPNSTQVVVVPEGFITDFASIPRLLWNILPPTGPYVPAALAHDLLYRDAAIWSADAPCPTAYRWKTIDRAFADNVFLEIMQVLGIGWWVRHAMYLGVRAGGWIAWNGHRESQTPPDRQEAA